MRNLLAFLGAVVLTLAILGGYLGWYEIYRSPEPSGRRTLHIDVDTDKVKDDLKRGGEKVLEKGKETIQEFVERRKNKTEEARSKAAGKDKEAGPAPQN